MTEIEQLRADVDQFMRRLAPNWFIEQNWFPPSMVGRNFYAVGIHCQHCGGDGKDPLGSTMNGFPCVCGFCGGSGNAADVSPDPNIKQCPECTGTGYAGGASPQTPPHHAVCDTCHGNGFVTIKQEKMTHG